MLQEGVAGSCNGGRSSCNIGSYNSSGGSYKIGGYTMVASRTLFKQLCWEFGVSNNCVCIISEGPLMYIVTCLETFYNFNRHF